MRTTALRLVISLGVAVLCSPSSAAWAQATGPDLTISLSHTGNFTVGQTGTYTIVVSNIGGAASGGLDVISDLGGSGTGGGWSCFTFILSVHVPPQLHCFSGQVLAPGASAAPITVTVFPSVSGTVTNTATVGGGGDTNLANNTATDVTLVMAAVPTLPEWALIALSVLLAVAGSAAIRRRRMTGCCTRTADS